MAWCHQGTSHYLGQCWPSSMSLYGVTGTQWVNYRHIMTLLSMHHWKLYQLHDWRVSKTLMLSEYLFTMIDELQFQHGNIIISVTHWEMKLSISIPKLQGRSTWMFGIDKHFHPTLYWTYDCILVLRLKLKLIYVGRISPSIQIVHEFELRLTWRSFCYYKLWDVYPVYCSISS